MSAWTDCVTHAEELQNDFRHEMGEDSVIEPIVINFYDPDLEEIDSSDEDEEGSDLD